MIRTLLIDDEEPARERLRRLLSDHRDIDVVAEAGDGQQALDRIAQYSPDLIFLDIEMPVRSGLEVAAAMPPPRPQVIFCTAFDSYAVAAFEHNAVDYLLKPVNRRRLSRSLERIRRSLRQARESHEIAAARTAQQRLFPDGAGEGATLDYYGSCRPSRGVGGDYYDFIPLGNRRFGFALGDVSGKGVYAGLLMAGLQGRLQSQAVRYRDDLESLFSELNRRMWRFTEADKFATLFFGVHDEDLGRLRYVNAGHPPPLRFHPGGVDPLDVGGVPLGLFEEAEYAAGVTALNPGDILVACSDGLLEANDATGREFGAERVIEAVRRAPGSSAVGLHDEIIRRLDRFRDGRELDDDLTLIVLKARPGGGKDQPS